MNSLTTVTNADFTVVDQSQVRDSLHITLTSELGGDRDFPLFRLDLTFDSTESEVFDAIDRAFGDDGIRLPRNGYTISKNAASNTITVHPKSEFGA